MLLSYIMAYGSQCHQRQNRREGNKLDRYWGITKHRKERFLRGRMLHVTLQHDFTSTLDSGVQTDMIVLEFSKLLTEFQTFSLPGRLHHDGIRGYPTVDHILPFLAEPSVAVEGCSSDSVPVLRGGGGSCMCRYWGPCYFCNLFCMCQILQTPLGEYLLLHGVRTEMAMNFLSK